MTRCPATLVGYVFEYHCELAAAHEGPHLHTYPASYRADPPVYRWRGEWLHTLVSCLGGRHVRDESYPPEPDR